ncbi:MAG: molecular chaperone HtpG, partial [Lachnospiraceae bacterium]
DYKEPLFWIHLNMDYPFNLKGILYFPKINTEYDSIEGTIKLYNNQVFIADNIKEVIPEFLMLLKGVIDCPDLPLNVSRSALQNDGFVKKISDYITKKVADKLSGMFKVDRENYEKYWDDISPFIKFGCIKDQKFKEKMMDYILYKDIEGKYITIDEYLEAKKGNTEEAEGAENAASETEITVENADGTAPETETNEDAEDKEPSKETVYYVTDEKQQSQYINMFKNEGLDAVILTHNIDTPFISLVESSNDKVNFQRIDADISESFKDDSADDTDDKSKETIAEVFKKALNNDKLEIKVEKLKNAEVSGVITLSEEGRRMQDMMKMYGMAGDSDMFAAPATLVLNSNNELVRQIIAHPKAKNTALYCEQVYDLARIAHSPLSSEDMTKFVARSNQIMMLLATK